MSDTEPPNDGPDLDGIDDEFAAMLADPSMWDQPGPGVEDRITDAIRSESTLDEPVGPRPGGSARRGWIRPALLGAVAAVVFLFGGIVVLSALSGVEDREMFSSELISTGVLTDVSGEVDITVFDSGLRIDLDAPTLPRRDDGKFYEGWLKTFDGNLIPVGTFHEGDSVVLWAGVGLDDVELFTITLEEAAGGQDPRQGSSGEVVLRTLVGG